MAIGMLLDIEGMSKEMYDEVNADANFPAEVPAGLISHVAGPIENGMRVFDIWESREDFGRFIGERLAPALERADADSIKLGDPQEFPIHDEFHR